MSQKTSSTEKFLTTKKLCNLISKNMANEYAIAKKEEPVIKDSDHTIGVNMFLKEIGDLCEKFSIKDHCETTKSGMRDSNGEWIPFLALTQMFEKEAPILTKFEAELAGLFEITPGQEEVTIKETLRDACSMDNSKHHRIRCALLKFK